jgi:hypothetical protein
MNGLGELKEVYDRDECLSQNDSDKLDYLVRDLHETLLPAMDDEYEAILDAFATLKTQISKVEDSWEANPANMTKLFIREQNHIDKLVDTPSPHDVWEATCRYDICDSYREREFEYSVCNDEFIGGSYFSCTGLTGNTFIPLKQHMHELIIRGYTV